MKLTTPKIHLSPKTTAVAVGTAVVILGLGATSAYADHINALPGSPLYPLKQAWREGRLALSFGPTDKAKTNIDFAKANVQSLQTKTVPPAIVAPTLQQAQAHLSTALQLSEQVSDTSQRKEIKKSISDTAKEVDTELKAKSEPEAQHPADSTDTEKVKTEVKHLEAASSTDN